MACGSTKETSSVKGGYVSRDGDHARYQNLIGHATGGHGFTLLICEGPVSRGMNPVMGRLADRWEREPLLFVFTVGFAVLAFTLERMLGNGTVSLFASMDVTVVLLATACAPLAQSSS